jgi:hypothetical protein
MIKCFKLLLVLLVYFICPMKYAYSQNNNLLMILMINPKYAGEMSQMKGVARYIKEDFAKIHASVQIEEVECDNIDKAISVLQKYNDVSKPLVIASGSSGIDTLKVVNSKFPQVFSVYLSHQIFDKYRSLLKTPPNSNGVNLVVLPKHVITSQIAKDIDASETKLVTTVGISHNLSKTDIIKEYELNKSDIPGTKSDKYTVVILGGDAQNTDQSWLYFTPADGINLAKNVEKSLDQDSYLFVLNGPRTGKHNYMTKEEDKEAHRSKKLDHVTQSFADYFKDHQKVKIFDFQYGKHGMYKAILGKILHTKESQIWVPAESTSMISEIVDTLGLDKNNKILVYEHNAMSNVHKAHVKSEYDAGRIMFVTQDGKIMDLADTSGGNLVASAAKSTADAILKLGRREIDSTIC